MSEAAYYAAHKAEYGCYPDENQPHHEDDDVFSEVCPKCDQSMNPDEKGKDGLCVNCTTDLGETIDPATSQNADSTPLLHPL